MAERWWGDFPFEIGETKDWRIGPFALRVERCREDWRMMYLSSGEALATDLTVAAPPDADPDPEMETVRFGFRETPAEFRLRPVVADRPVILKAQAPFFVPPGEEITLYMSTALWLRARIGASWAVVWEGPLHRPTDTWFGPSTREGELGYAATTGPRLNLENLPRRPHRAISVVHIRNRGRSQLALDRIKLPVPNLALYASADAQLWTEPITLLREADDETASMTLGNGAPAVAGPVERIAGPRQEGGAGLLARTFGTLLGRKGARWFERLAE